MIFIPLIALVAGIALGLLLNQPLPGIAGTYLALACVAGLDSVLGGVRSALESKFDSEILVTGFVSNTLIAFGLGYLGDQIGLNLFLASALVLGGRIFTNLSVIRRYGITRLRDARARREMLNQDAAPGPKP